MEKEIYSKVEAIQYVWQYSRYYGNLLSYCEKTADDGDGFASLIFLFNLTENILKNRTKDYDANLFEVIKTLRNQGIITQIEYKFLNNKNNSIRNLRNLLAHANLSKYNLLFIEDGKKILYPLTENETCLKLYEMVSPILFNLMSRIVSIDFQNSVKINLDENINNIEIRIEELSPEKLMEFKGVDVSTIPGWDNLTDTDKYRYAENTSDVSMLENIYKNLL